MPLPSGNEMDYVKRKSPRLQGYDYKTPNYYFITICTHNKEKIFGTEFQLNGFGNIAKDGFLQINKHYLNTKIDKFVVMPNHVHAIVVTENETDDLNIVIGSYKSYVSKEIHKNNPN